MSKVKIIISGIVVFLLLLTLGATFCISIYIDVYWPLNTILVICFLINIFYGIWIINSKRSWYVKTCWLLVLIIFSIVGLIIFLIFGINPLKKKHRKTYLKSQKELLNYEDFSFSNKIMNDKNNDFKWIFKYGLLNMMKPIYENKFEIIDDNTQLFEKSINLIRSAKTYINIQSYIFNYSGFWTKILFTELIKKANEGVKIRLIYDWLGAHRRIQKKVFDKLRKYGIEVACFNPKGFTMFKGATNYRLHSKFIIVDNKIALYGGSNFADEYLSMSKKHCHWKDLNFLITGNIVNTMNITFINYWINFSKKNNGKNSNQNLRNDVNLILKKPFFPHFNTLAQLLIFEPDFNEFTLENTFIHFFYKAKKSIKILTPYFCPPASLIRALQYCHIKKQIKIEIIIHKKNQKYVQMINRENCKKIVDVGINVYEYDGYLHSKCIIIDDEYVMVGSCNVDYRSIYLDFESELIVYDKDFAKKINYIFEKTKLNSTLQTNSMLANNLNRWNRFLLKLLNVGKSLF